MKKCNLILTIMSAGLILFSGSAIAQNENPAKVKELGLSFYSLNSFGIRYKTGSAKTLLRLNAVALNCFYDKSNTATRDSLPIKNSGFKFGVKAGLEKRIPIVKNLDFLTGFDAGVFFDYSHNDLSGHSGNEVDNTTSWDIMPELDLVLGFNYHIGTSFCVSAEINPALTYTHSEVITKLQFTPSSDEKKVKYIGNDINFGLSSSSASITISYVFGK